VIFRDIVIAQQFIEEFDKAPSKVKNQVDRKVHQLALEGAFRPSANLHRVHGTDELWICYVNQDEGAWRMIVSICEKKLHLYRLLSHAQMMKEYNPSILS